MQRNPECDTNDANAPNWACMNGSVLLPFSSDPWHGGPVLVTAQEGPFTRQVGLRGLGGPSTSSAIGLHLTTNPGTLSARLNLAAQWAWNPFTGTGPFSFYLSGGYTVSAAAVPSPLALTEGPADDDGARTYTVAPIDGLQFRNPIVAGGWHFPAGTITWHFFPGDSVSTAPGWEGQSREISGCIFQPVCRYTPPGPGRVQVSAYIEGQQALGRSTGGAPDCPEARSGSGALVVGDACEEQEPTLKLECVGDLGSGRVTRGETVTCTARKDPAGAPGQIAITSWTFNGVARTDGDTHALTWSGTMVAAGAITVTGKVGSGVEETAIDTVSVEARRWPRLRIAGPAHDSAAGHLPPEPSPTPSGIGYNLSDLADFHLEQVMGSLPFNGRSERITSGPNTDWWYVNRPLRNPYVLVHHSDAWKPSSPWYQKQHGPPPYCRQSDIDLLYRRALLHEGLSTTPIPGDIYQPAYSHYTAARNYFENLNDVNATFERQTEYRPGGDTLQTGFETSLLIVWIDSVANPHTTYNIATVHTNQSLVPFHCKLR